jgi:hypothetical protein
VRRLVGVCALPLLATLGGCPASIEGNLDDLSIPSMLSAFFVERPGEGDALSVNASGLSLLDGCNRTAKRQDAFNEAFDQFIGDIDGETDPDRIKRANEDFVDAQVEYDQQNLPSDYWTVSIGVSAADDRDIEEGVESEIDIEKPVTDQDVFSSVTICRVNDWPEADEDANDNPVVDADQDCWGAIEAVVTVGAYEPGASFDVVAEAVMGEIDPDTGIDPDEDVGEVKITVHASYCEPLEKALDDTEDVQKDLPDVLTGGGSDP